MGKFGGVWANSDRNVRALATAITLGAFLIIILVYDSFMPSLIERKNTNAVLLEVKSASSNKGQMDVAALKLQLTDNNIVNIYMSGRQYPKVGDSVPLILEMYDDDTQKYYFDHQSWRRY